MSVALAVIAMLIELCFGYPERIANAIGHPATWIGRLIGALDRLLNRETIGAHARRAAGIVAVLAGWITTETGRQPFTVYGLLRTADSASPLASPAVGSSLIAFVIVYFAVFSAGIIYILRLMAQPPQHGELGPQGDFPARAAGITPAVAAVAKGEPR